MSQPSDALAAPRQPAAGITSRRSLRHLWAIEDRPAVVSFAQTVPGRVLLVLLFAGVLMLLKDASWWQAAMVAGAAEACAFVPRWRVQIVFGATFAMLLGKQTFWFVTTSIGEVMRQEQVAQVSERVVVYAALPSSCVPGGCCCWRAATRRVMVPGQWSSCCWCTCCSWRGVSPLVRACRVWRCGPS